MITSKQKAIKYIQSGVFDFNNIDKRLLQDRDIALAYMRTYSSNEMLFDGFPIDIAAPGMIDSQAFVLHVIKNLGEGYSREAVNSMIRYSTIRIVKREAGKLESVNFEMLKDFSERILTKYGDVLKKRNQELQQGQNIVTKLCEYITNFKLDGLEAENENKSQAPKVNSIDEDKYKRSKIGFNADI